MVNKSFLYAMLFLFSIVIISFSQILMKKSAAIRYPNHIREYLNKYVLGAYAIVFLSNFLNNVAYPYVSLSLGTILSATQYIFVALLSVVFLKEKLSRKKLLGLALIILGALLFAI